MADTAPPPPPLPGTSGAPVMPHWRETYQPHLEAVPSRNQIEKQQYAHLPDKLLNTLNKDKKPFTYTPQGVSSEKGVLDLSEIRSPRMKKRLMANLHSGEEETDQSSDERASQPSPSNPPVKPQANIFQQPFAPMVLPPLSGNQLRSTSPNQAPRKEVRFAPSPVPGDDEELANVLLKRKADVEARAKIVTNEPAEEEEEEGQEPFPPAQQPTINIFKRVPEQPLAPLASDEDVEELVQRSAETVQAARNIFGSMPVSNNNQNNEILVEDVEDEEYAPAGVRRNLRDEEEVEETINQIENDLNEIQIKNTVEETEEIEEEEEEEEEEISVPEESRPPPPPPPPPQPASSAARHCPSPTPVPQLFHQPEVRNYQPPPEILTYQPQPEIRTYDPVNLYSMTEPFSPPTTVPQYNPWPAPVTHQPIHSIQESSDILRHVLDDGLQDEIDKFEQNFRETAMSPKPEMYRNSCVETNHYRPASAMNSRGQVPPPVPPKPKRDGRTSCPPYADYQNYQPQNYNCQPQQNLQPQNDSFMSSFRCISPSFEILQKTQTTGYNYAPKPRPFYRTSFDNDDSGVSAFRPMSQQSSYPQYTPPTFNTFKPIEIKQAHQNERQIPIQRTEYTAQNHHTMNFNSLPRKIKLNTDLAQPKSYDNREAGREFISNLGMFSQLPPKTETNNGCNSQNGADPPSPEIRPQKMYYGAQTLPRKINIPGRSVYNSQPKTYEDKEAGREFLSNAKMFSQLSPQSSEPVNNGYQAQNRSNSGSNSGSNGFNSRFNGFANYQPPPPAPQPSSFVSRRQTSLPPPTPPPKRYPGCYMDLLPTPSSPQPEVVNSPMRSQPRLTPSQIRRLPPSERPPEPNPSKYTGSHIPSRSFRLLQLITGEDIENQYAEPVEQQQQQSPPVSERTSSVASVSKPIQRPQHQPPLPPTMASSSFNSSFDYGTDF